MRDETARQSAIDYTATETAARMFKGDTRTIRDIAVEVLSISQTPEWVMDVADDAERTNRAWNRFLGEIEKRCRQWI